MIIAGNKIYEKCVDCQKLVQINKFFLGSLHVCLSDEEKTMIENQQQAMKRQEDFTSQIK